MINKYFFTIGNLVFKQGIGILIGIDRALFWTNIYIYIYIYIYLFDISITYLFQLELLKHIIIIEFQESLTTYIVLINDGNEFPISFKNIYPKELELKVKHHGIKASFLGLEIKIEETD